MFDVTPDDIAQPSDVNLRELAALGVGHRLARPLGQVDDLEPAMRERRIAALLWMMRPEPSGPRGASASSDAGMTADVANAPARKRFRDADVGAIEKAIRRIVRAHDLQSRALVKASGLTAAQLVVMKGIADLGEVTSAALSTYADISAATVVTVLDNLEERNLIHRYRSGSDRRIVHTRLTERGLAALASAPSPLGDLFLQRFAHLDTEERRRVVTAVTELANLLSRETGMFVPPPEASLGSSQVGGFI